MQQIGNSSYQAQPQQLSQQLSQQAPRPVLDPDKIFEAISNIAYQWEDIALNLRISSGKIKAIATDYSISCERALRAMLNIWVNEYDADIPKLAQAIARSGDNVLAKKVAGNYQRDPNSYCVDTAALPQSQATPQEHSTASPSSARLQQLQSENQKLLSQNQRLQSENQQLRSESTLLNQQLAEQRRLAGQLTQENRKLQSDLQALATLPKTQVLQPPAASHTDTEKFTDIPEFDLCVNKHFGDVLDLFVGKESNWDKIALEIGISTDKITSIRRQRHNEADKCLWDSIEIWMKRGDATSRSLYKAFHKVYEVQLGKSATVAKFKQDLLKWAKTVQ